MFFHSWKKQLVDNCRQKCNKIHVCHLLIFADFNYSGSHTLPYYYSPMICNNLLITYRMAAVSSGMHTKPQKEPAFLQLNELAAKDVSFTVVTSWWHTFVVDEPCHLKYLKFVRKVSCYHSQVSTHCIVWGGENYEQCLMSLCFWFRYLKYLTFGSIKLKLKCFRLEERFCFQQMIGMLQQKTCWM